MATRNRATEKPQALTPDRMIYWQPCASACTDTHRPADNPLCLQFGLDKDGGWERLVKTELDDAYALGYRRFVLHLPFGNEHNGPMPWDAMSDAIEHGLARVLVSWQRAMRWAESNMPLARFIVYMGSAFDRDLTRLWDAGEDYRHAKRLTDNLLGFLRFQNVTLAFDHAASYRADDPAFHLVRFINTYLNRRGTPVFMESFPIVQASTERSGDRLVPDTMTAQSQLDQRDRLRPHEVAFAERGGGEIVVWYTGGGDKVEWMHKMAARGYTVAQRPVGSVIEGMPVYAVCDLVNGLGRDDDS